MAKGIDLDLKRIIKAGAGKRDENMPIRLSKGLNPKFQEYLKKPTKPISIRSGKEDALGQGNASESEQDIEFIDPEQEK